MKKFLIALGIVFIPAISWGAQADLSWQDPGAGVSVKVERGTDPAGPFTLQGTVASPQTSFSQTVAEAPQYCYKLTKTNAFGDATTNAVICGPAQAPIGAPANTILIIRP